MAIVIGAGTVVSNVSFRSASSAGCVGATQANWDYSTNTQRQYQLGSWSACATYNTPQQTLSLTFYSGSTSKYSVAAVTSCMNMTVTADISLAGCDLPIASFVGPWYVTSYSHSKGDARQPGTENWSLMKYTGTPGDDAPTYNIRGISEGTINSDYSINEQSSFENLTGIEFDNSSVISQGSTGSVSAGQTGTAENTYASVVAYIGGSVSAVGKVGSGNVSIPFTALWT